MSLQASDGQDGLRPSGPSWSSDGSNGTEATVPLRVPTAASRSTLLAPSPPPYPTSATTSLRPPPQRVDERRPAPRLAAGVAPGLAAPQPRARSAARRPRLGDAGLPEAAEGLADMGAPAGVRPPPCLRRGPSSPFPPPPPPPPRRMGMGSAARCISKRRSLQRMASDETAAAMALLPAITPARRPSAVMVLPGTRTATAAERDGCAWAAGGGSALLPRSSSSARGRGWTTRTRTTRRTWRTTTRTMEWRIASWDDAPPQGFLPRRVDPMRGVRPWVHGECAGLRSVAAAERVEHYVCPLCCGASELARAASTTAGGSRPPRLAEATAGGQRV